MSLRIRIERTDAPRTASGRRRWTVGTATVVAAVLVSGVAYAYWTATGTGSGTSKALSAQVAGVTATVSPVADLYPGKTGGAVSFTVTNPNPYQVTFTSLAVGAVTSGDEAGCPASLVTVTTPVTVSITVPAGTPSAVQSIAGVTAMDINAPDGCQGVSFDVVLNLSGMQT